MRGDEALDPDFDQVLFRSTHLVVGSFRAHPAHVRFADSGPAANDLFVFPRTAVAIQHEGAAPFVAGPPIVTFYNRGQRYRRLPVAPDGDRCEWFALSEPLLDGLRSTAYATSRRDTDGPFPFTHGPSAPDVYVRQRRFVNQCLGPEPPDVLAAEETAIGLAARVMTDAAAVWRGRSGTHSRTRHAPHRDLAEHAKEILLLRFAEPLSVTAIARAVGCTPFHLCRVFRRSTGWRLHQFRDQVRLRVALEHVRSRRGDLTDLALELGYSSHSHFTAAFRRSFGLAPSTLRRT